MVDVIFICGGKDFHAMDKFKLVFDFIGCSRIILVTDTIEGEGQKSLLNDDYRLEKLLIIDKFLPNFQTKWTNIYRNIVKFLLLPIQALLLKKIYRKYVPFVVHATPMYYMLLCRFAAIPYIGTPQASEILERSKRSVLYSFFAKKALMGANQIIVDSVAMKEVLESKFKVKSVVIKNGFDTSLALFAQKLFNDRTKVISIRGLQDNYQILKIIHSRNISYSKLPINFVYPFYDTFYLNKVKSLICSSDQLHGLENKKIFYDMLSASLLAISLPSSDSSPRSVYESIFCGAAVAITYMGYYDELPSCMKSRIYIVDTNNQFWFDEALEFAKKTIVIPYIPSDEALKMCDQRLLMKKLINNIYKLDCK